MRHVIGLSGGKDSTALALALRQREPRDYDYICTPTGDELPDMLAHWAKLEDILGKPIIRLTAKVDLNGLIQIQKALPNFRMRWCTRVLKIEPTIAWVRQNNPVTMYVGLRADEETREGIYAEDVLCDFPFRRWGWGIVQVLDCLKEHGITIPVRTDCARCYHQKIEEWHRLWRDHKQTFWHASNQEDQTGHTFRSPGRDTWPVALKDLAQAFSSGRKIPHRENKQGTICRVCSL